MHVGSAPNFMTSNASTQQTHRRAGTLGDPAHLALQISTKSALSFSPILP